MLGARDLATFGLVRKEGRGVRGGVHPVGFVSYFLFEKRAVGGYLVRDASLTGFSLKYTSFLLFIVFMLQVETWCEMKDTRKIDLPVGAFFRQ